MSRRRLALVVTIAVVATAGCIGPFGESAIPDAQLGESADYDWNVSANATYTITTNGTYRAVYRLPPAEATATDEDVTGADTTGETRTLQLHRRDGLGQRRPLDISALRYRYPNGTVENGTALEANQGNQRTTVTLPAGDGTVAYTARSPPKRFETAIHVEGSHDVILPPDRRVGNPIFGHVSPPTDNRSWRSGDRRVLHWETVERDQTREEVEFDASDFEREDTPPDRPEETTGGTAAAAPGFGPVVGAVALLGAGLLARRRQ